MCSIWSIQKDTTAYVVHPRGWRGNIGSTYYRTGDSVWQIWVPKNHSHVKARRMASESQEGRKNLEERRAESTEEAAEDEEDYGLTMALVSG